ncbi:MAG: aminoglycoside phosphotransferase family protein [Minicystis sp.]
MSENRDASQANPADAARCTFPLAVAVAVRRLGLARARERIGFTRLEGGVSSDVWRVDLPGGPVCAKRALAKLRVAADWRAPVSRGENEFRFLVAARNIIPAATPVALGRAQGVILMQFFPPERHPVWKDLLRQGRVEDATARAVAGVLAQLHAQSSRDPSLAGAFRDRDIFHATRIEPYFEYTARARPEHAAEIRRLARRTEQIERTLVHGDVSPKNILVGPDGPVLLDAECAIYGDPAFDLAFCVTHLLLKCVALPFLAERLSRCVDAFVNEYERGVSWEPASDLDARAADLVPVLLLARVDGKSPVEYLDREQRAVVRRAATGLLLHPARGLARLGEAWRAATFAPGAERSASC